MTVSDHHPRVLATLLLALHDRLRTIRAPRWQRENEAGFMRTIWHTCPDCDQGTATWKNRKITCRRCQGEGRWRTDPYDTNHRPLNPTSHGIADMTLSEFWTTAEHVARDRGAPALERLEGLIERGLARELDDELADSARTTARADHPSVIALWDSLSVMLRDWPHHGGILYRVYVWAWTPEEHLGDHDRELTDDALLILAETLKVRSPHFRAPTWALRAVEAELAAERVQGVAGRWANPALKAERDAEVLRLSANGASARTIAKRMQVDRRTIDRIIDRQAA